MDHVQNFRIVTADGETRTVTATSDPDYYWSVLGGSPGSWGVVLEYTVEAIPAPDYPNSALVNYMFPYDREAFLAVNEAATNVTLAAEGLRDFSIMMTISPFEQAP